MLVFTELSDSERFLISFKVNEACRLIEDSLGA